MLTTNVDYMLDGVKGGAARGSIVERYFISGVPDMMEILKRAETHNTKATIEDPLHSVAMHKSTEEALVRPLADLSSKAASHMPLSKPSQ